MKIFKANLKTRIKTYLKVSGKNLHEKIECEPGPETYGEYYIRIYGEIPDFARHKNNGFYVDLNTHRPNLKIAQVIKKEEEKYISSLKRNKNMILKKYSDESKLDGKTLSFLHHTHGCDPSLVEDILELDLPQALHDDYLREYIKHKQTGGK